MTTMPQINGAFQYCLPLCVRWDEDFTFMPLGIYPLIIP
jgi:hypothetical protein